MFLYCQGRTFLKLPQPSRHFPIHVYFISNLIDLLEAPGSFIMGCDSRHDIHVKSLLAAQDEVMER